MSIIIVGVGQAEFDGKIWGLGGSGGSLGHWNYELNVSVT